MAKHPDPNVYTLQTSHTAHEAKLLYRILIQVRTTVLTPMLDTRRFRVRSSY